MIGSAPLSLGERRQARPPPLRLPTGPGGLNVKSDIDNPLKTPMRTPGPASPMMYKVDPSAITPDTAEFPRDIAWGTTRPWTENEEGIIEAYLARPPRSTSQAYAPGELPPANIIGEIALQILKIEGSKSSGWSRSFEETRRKVFAIARRESMEKVGGHHRRTPSDMSDPSERPDMADQALEDAIDTAGSELVIPNFAVALSLNESDNGKRSTGPPLASPMEMNFAPLTSTSVPRRVQISNGAHGQGPRPPSLLQRGQSFTSSDLLSQKKFTVKPTPDVYPEDQASVTVIPGAREGGGSPVSTITSSPPSSVDSYTNLREAEMEVEVEPYTPVNQTFPSNIHSSNATPIARRMSNPKTETMTATPKQTVSNEIPWTAPNLGRSDSGNRRAQQDEAIISEADRNHKRQKTRTGGRASSDDGQQSD